MGLIKCRNWGSELFVQSHFGTLSTLPNMSLFAFILLIKAVLCPCDNFENKSCNSWTNLTWNIPIFIKCVELYWLIKLNVSSVQFYDKLSVYSISCLLPKVKFPSITRYLTSFYFLLPPPPSPPFSLVKTKYTHNNHEF